MIYFIKFIKERNNNYETHYHRINRANVRSFMPMLKLDVYNTLLQATQSIVDLINHDLTKFGDDSHLKTDNFSWEILDFNNNSWERSQIKKINTYKKRTHNL